MTYRHGILKGLAALTLSALLLLMTGGEASSSPAAASRKPATLDAFGFLADNALFAGGARVEDLGAVWDRWMGLFEKFQTEEERLEMRQNLEKARTELGFDIRNDLLPLFRGEIAFGLSLESLDAVMGLGMNPNPAGAEQTLSGALLAVGCTDAQKLDRIVDILLAKEELKREAAGTLDSATIWRLPFGGDEPNSIPLYYAHYRGRVLMGFSPAALQNAADRYRTGPNLAGSSDFVRVRSQLPRDLTTIGYVNLPAVAQRIREAGLLKMAAAADPRAMDVLMEFTSPEMVPFGMGWGTAVVDGGYVRQSYGPNTFLGQLPLGGSGFGAPMMAAIAVPNLVSAIQRGKSKRTMADIRSVATALEAFSIDENGYPVQDSLSAVDAIAGRLEPTYIRSLPRRDGWERELMYWSDGESYRLVSTGKNGELEAEAGAYRMLDSAAPFDSGEEDRDIVFGDGMFLRYPE